MSVGGDRVTGIDGTSVGAWRTGIGMSVGGGRVMGMDGTSVGADSVSVGSESVIVVDSRVATTVSPIVVTTGVSSDKVVD